MGASAWRGTGWAERVIQTGTVRSRCGGEAARPRRQRGAERIVLHRRSCHAGPGGRRAWMLCCRSSICAGSRWAISRRHSRRCWAAMPEPVAVGDRQAAGRVGGGLCALAAARPVGPALRVCLGRRCLPAGTHGAPGRVHAGADRRDARGQEGTGRLPGGYAGERTELAGTAGRHQGARIGHRARTGHRRRGTRLLEGP